MSASNVFNFIIINVGQGLNIEMKEEEIKANSERLAKIGFFTDRK